jgi:hypothetical protein
MRRKRGGTMKTEPPSGLTSPRSSKRQAEPALAGSGKSAGGPAFRKAELARFLVRARQAAGLRGRVDLMLADDATLAQPRLPQQEQADRRAFVSSDGSSWQPKPVGRRCRHLN